MKPKDLKVPFTWEDRRPMIESGVLFVPHYYPDHEAYILPSWKEIFGNDNEIVVEYCSGNGHWIIEKAKSDPTRNWVAVEKQFERVRKIWSKKENEGIKNLLIVCGEALTFTKSYLKEHPVSEIFINYPDPWPKEKHAKHRLFSPKFIEEMARVLKVGGKSTFVTDDPTYRDRIVETVFSHPSWSSANRSPYLIDVKDYGYSYFADLWKEKGRRAYHIECVRNNVSEIVLPAGPRDDLDWSEQIVQAEQVEGSIFWRMECGFLEHPHFLNDRALFASASLAMKQFTEKMWPLFGERTKGLSLIRIGEDDLEPKVEIFQALSEYLHQLVALLPEELAIYAPISLSQSVSKGECAHILLKERFPHITITPQIESEVAICLPRESSFTPEVIEQIDRLVNQLDQYRFIAEYNLNEEWEGVDQLIVFEEMLSPMGKRMVQGFIATGGTVIPATDLLGVLV